MNQASIAPRTEVASAAPPLCLLVHVEPTTYLLHRLEHFRDDEQFRYEVWYVKQNASQTWPVEVDPDSIICPGGRWQACRRALRLTAKILAGRYQVAHLSGWGHPVLLLLFAVLKLQGIPFSVDSDSQLRRDRSTAKEKLKSLLYPVLLRMPAAVLPGGSRQAQFFRAYGVPEERIRIAHMTVDTERIRNLTTPLPAATRASCGISTDAIVFLYVGRLETYKGPQLLLQAFDQLKAADAVLVLIGEGALREEVQSWSAARRNRIKWLLAQPFTSVIQWMRASDVLVVPSLAEQWGLVINEGMTCGLPIIATDRVGAVDDLVADGVNGYVVSGDSVEALAQAMRALLDRGLRQRMAARSLEIIRPWTTARESAVIKATLAEICRKP